MKKIYINVRWVNDRIQNFGRELSERQMRRDYDVTIISLFDAAFPSQLPKNPAENYVNCQLLKF